MSTKLRVVEIQIRDVLGVTERQIEPGQITVLRGPNGSAKTSVLGAVQTALGGGSLAKIARIDSSGEETEPEVVLVLEGAGAEAYRVERTAGGVRVRSRVGQTAGFEDVAKPQAWLSGLFDAPLANPVRFLTAPDKDRALMLLEALPLHYERQALLAEMGVREDEIPKLPDGYHPLEEIALIRDAVFRTRTGVNRDAKGKAAAAEQTRRNAPAVPPEDVSGLLAQKEAGRAALAASIAREDAEIHAAEAAAIKTADAALKLVEGRVAQQVAGEEAKLRMGLEAKAAEIRAEAERRVAELTADAEKAIRELIQRGEKATAEAAASANQAKTEAFEARTKASLALDERRRELGRAVEELASLRATAESGAKARALHAQAEQFDDEAAQLEAESARLTKALETLDAFRTRLASDLPIPGLSIEDKVIRVDGVPFEQLNTAQRVKIAVRVATLRAKGQRLPVLFVDGAEALDQEHFDSLVSELKAAGVQAFVARVGDEPGLEIETA